MGGYDKPAANIYERDADDAISFQHLPFGESGFGEQGSGAVIEILEVAREVDDLRRVAIAPLDVDGFSVFHRVLWEREAVYPM